MTAVPKFQAPDYWAEFFIGHWFNHDVYLVKTGGMSGWSLTARHGDEPWEYGSLDLSHYETCLAPGYDGRIGLLDGTVMPYQEFLFSPHAGDYHKAIMMGLAWRGRQLRDDEKP